MAGAPAGYRTFAAGEVLTAANVQTYLQDQVVSVYADAAAADAALASPAEGQFRWLSDVDAFQVYSGSAWVAAGGGAAGSVLQVVSTTKTDTFSTSSTSYTDVTGLSVSITPSSTSSKIMVFATVNSGRLGGLPTFQLVRVSTAIGVGDAAGSRTRASMSNYPGGDSIGVQLTTVAVEFLDSPSTTSATTYKIQARTESSTLYVNRSGTDTDSATYPRVVSSITVMEVAG
jgi:hypothetical protein